MTRADGRRAMDDDEEAVDALPVSGVVGPWTWDHVRYRFWVNNQVLGTLTDDEEKAREMVWIRYCQGQEIVCTLHYEYWTFSGLGLHGPPHPRMHPSWGKWGEDRGVFFGPWSKIEDEEGVQHKAPKYFS